MLRKIPIDKFNLWSSINKNFEEKGKTLHDDKVCRKKGVEKQVFAFLEEFQSQFCNENATEENDKIYCRQAITNHHKRIPAGLFWNRKWTRVWSSFLLAVRLIKCSKIDGELATTKEGNYFEISRMAVENKLSCIEFKRQIRTKFWIRCYFSFVHDYKLIKCTDNSTVHVGWHARGREKGGRQNVLACNDKSRLKKTTEKIMQAFFRGILIGVCGWKEFCSYGKCKFHYLFDVEMLILRFSDFDNHTNLNFKRF